VHPNGSKYWRVKYRIGGKEKTLALGVYPDVTLTEARAKRDDARKLIGNGADPITIKREQKRQEKLKAANSFEAIAREWHENQKGRWIPDHANKVICELLNTRDAHICSALYSTI